MADFQKYANVYAKRDIRVVGGSTDTREEALKTQNEYNLPFPLAYGLDAVEFSRLTGAFYNPDRFFLDGTGFIIDPSGTVRAGVYSTGPIGRYTPRECIAMIDYFRKKDARQKAGQEAEIRQ